MHAVNLLQCRLTQMHLNHLLVINIEKRSAIKMQVSAKEDCHPKQKGRRDLQLTFINTNNYRKEVNTCDVLCVILRTICNAKVQCLLESLLSYLLLLGNSTTTPILVVPPLYLAHVATQKPTLLHAVEVLLGMQDTF